MTSQSTQGGAVVCVRDESNHYYVASLNNSFGPCVVPRLLVDTGCATFLLTLSTKQQRSIRRDDTTLTQLQTLLPPNEYTYSLSGAGDSVCLIVTHTHGTPFSVKLATEFLGHHSPLVVPYLRFHVSVYDAQYILTHWDLTQLTSTTASSATDGDAIRKILKSVTASQLSHAVLGQTILQQIPFTVITPAMMVLVIGRDFADMSSFEEQTSKLAAMRECFLANVQMMGERLSDWMQTSDNDADATPYKSIPMQDAGDVHIVWITRFMLC